MDQQAKDPDHRFVKVSLNFSDSSNLQQYFDQHSGGRTCWGKAVEVRDAAEKQAGALQPASQPVGHLQAGRLQAGRGLGENPSALEDLMQVKMQIISIFAKSSKVWCC